MEKQASFEVEKVRQFFENAECAHWYDQYVIEQKMFKEEALNYEQWFEQILMPNLMEFDSITLWSDGCLYGNKNGICHDLDYEWLERNNWDLFLELYEQYGKPNSLEYKE